MRIGIDCDGVLRDFIPDLIDSIKETHPQHADKILEPKSWDWEQWLPFWTDDETEKYVFQDNFLDFFGVEASPIKEAVEDWPKLVQWAKENDHELVLVSAQRENCKEPTTEWLQKWGFTFDEMHYTKHIFSDRSVAYGRPICMKQSWNDESQKKYMTINRLSDIMTRVFG